MYFGLGEKNFISRRAYMKIKNCIRSIGYSFFGLYYASKAAIVASTCSCVKL